MYVPEEMVTRGPLPVRSPTRGPRLVAVSLGVESVIVGRRALTSPDEAFSLETLRVRSTRVNLVNGVGVERKSPSSWHVPAGGTGKRAA